MIVPMQRKIPCQRTFPFYTRANHQLSFIKRPSVAMNNLLGDSFLLIATCNYPHVGSHLDANGILHMVHMVKKTNIHQKIVNLSASMPPSRKPHLTYVDTLPNLIGIRYILPPTMSSAQPYVTNITQLGLKNPTKKLRCQS